VTYIVPFRDKVPSFSGSKGHTLCEAKRRICKWQ